MPFNDRAEMCTKTSFPPSSGVMKPKPLLVSKNLTTPVLIIIFSYRRWFLPHSIDAERSVDFKEEFEEKSETALGRSNESASSRTHCLGNRYSLFEMRFFCSLRIGVFVAEMLIFHQYAWMYVRVACWTGYLRQGGFKSVQFFDGSVGLVGVIRN